MSRFDQYKIPNVEPESRFAKYRFDLPSPTNLEIAGKGVASGALSLLDIPQALAAVGDASMNPEYSPYGQARKFYRQWKGEPENPLTGPLEQMGSISSLPWASEKIKETIKEYGDVDLDTEPVNATQRILQNATQFAGGVGPFGAFGKGIRTFDRAKKVAKGTTLGASIGGTSGVLQEGGIDPLVADIGSVFALPTAGVVAGKGAKGAKNLLSRFTTAGRDKRIENEVRNIFVNQVGKEKIPEVLKNLENKLPLGATPTTAQLAKTPGISGLERMLAPNVGEFAEREALNDQLIRRELEALSPQRGLDKTEIGEKIRETLATNLEEAKAAREQGVRPLYTALKDIVEPVKLDNTRLFLHEEGKYAKGDIKKTLDYVEGLISDKTLSKAEKTSIEKSLKQFENSSPQVKAQLIQAFAVEQRPIEINNAIKDINGRIGASKRSGNNEITRVLTQAKDNLIKDLVNVPEDKIARETYAALSKPVNAIEDEARLKKIVKKDHFDNDYLMSPELITDEILRGDVKNTQALMKQLKSDPEAVNALRESMINKFVQGSELASVNALDTPNLSYNKMKKFLSKYEDKLPEIFEESQIKVLKDTEEILKRRAMVSTLGRAAGSNTQSELTLLNSLGMGESLGGKYLKDLPGGKYIAGIYKLTQAQEKSQIKRLVEEALLNPDVAKKLLTPTKNIKDQSTLNELLMSVGIPFGSYILTTKERK